MSKRLETLRSQLEALIAERNAARAELIEIAERDSAPADDEHVRTRELVAKVGDLDPKIDTAEAELRQLEAVLNAPERSIERTAPAPTIIVRNQDDPFARGREFGAPHEVRDAAFRAVERVSGLDANERAAAEHLVRRVDTPDGRLARHILVTGRDEYRAAFHKFMAGRPELMLDDERRAVMEARTSSLTDGQGGYAIPFNLDPSVIHTSTYAGAGHPWRQVASVVPVVGDNWNGIASSGVTASMVGEGDEAIDANPTFTQPSIAVKKAQAFVKYTEEIYADWSSYESEIRDMFVWAKDVLEDAQFATGSGSGNNVNGLVTDLVAASTPIVASVTANDITTLGDLFALENALAKRFRMNASWLATRTIYNKFRAVDTAANTTNWSRSLGDGLPDRLLSYPMYEVEGMDSTYGSGENYVVIFGDVRQAYKIIDRIGMTIQNYPSLLGTGNNLPNGTGGLRMVWRFGAKAVNTTACKILNVT